MKDIKEIGKSDFNNINYIYNKYFNLIWEITQRCDMNCDYCTLHDNKVSYKDDKTIYAIIDKINKINGVSDKLFLNLFGGEPTQHPMFLDIIKMLDINGKIDISTNLNYDIEYLQQILSLNKINFIEITYHSKKTNDDNFIDKINLIKKYNIGFEIFIMLERGYESKVINMFNILKSKDVNNITIRPVNFDINDVYFDTYKDFIIDNQIDYQKHFYYIDSNDNYHKLSLEDIRLKDFVHFYMYECNAKKYKLYIDENGYCYPCDTYRRYNKSIFNILNKDVDIIQYMMNEKNKRFICTVNYCNCCDLKFIKKRILNV